MAIYDYLVFGKTLSFDVYPGTVIGSTFSNVKVLAILDRDTANIWIDTAAMHVNVYPMLPNGVPDDPSQYQYVKLQHPNGKISVVGIPWINESTIQVIEVGTLVITVDNVGVDDRERIINALNANGYRAARVVLN